MMFICPFCEKSCKRKSSFSLHKKHCKKNPLMVPKIGIPHTQESKEKIRQAALRREVNSPRRGAGKGKKGWFKGIWCDSSWELAYVVYCLDFGIPIKRCDEIRHYVFEEKTRSYYPDFKNDSKIIEIKGWITPQFQAKYDQNSDIVVLTKKEMIPILNYVKNTYGKNYIYLYDGVNPKKREILNDKEQEELTLKKQLEMISNIDITLQGSMKEISKILGMSEKKTRSFVKKNFSNYNKTKNILSKDEIENRLKSISGIDFSKFGWVEQVSKILGLSRASSRRFVDKYYSGETFKRKSKSS